MAEDNEIQCDLDLTVVDQNGNAVIKGTKDEDECQNTTATE